MRIDAGGCRSLLLAGCLMLPALCGAAGGHALQELIAGRRCSEYVPLTEQQLQQAETAFERLFTDPADPAGDAARVWSELGFNLTRVADAGAAWLVLHEPPGRCRGQGLYLIRQDPASGVLLQVPHGYSDRFTDDIAAGLLQAPLRAIALNTVPRRLRLHGARIDADLAHREDNLFAPLTRAFARACPAGRVVQLHGFSSAKRKTAEGRTAAAIVSAGTRWPTAASMAVADCLQSLLDEPVRLYPRDVRELGATTNTQGRLLRGQAHDGFVHVELNAALRDRLRGDGTLRTGLAGCLSRGLEPQ